MGRSIAVLKLSHRIKNVITFAQSVASALTNNASFPSPNPPLATLQADTTALSNAETAVLARTKGAVQDRNAKLATLRTGSFGMTVRRCSGVTGKNGPVSSSRAELSARCGHGRAGGDGRMSRRGDRSSRWDERVARRDGRSSR